MCRFFVEAVMKKRAAFSVIIVAAFAGMAVWGCAKSENSFCVGPEDCLDGLICRDGECVSDTCNDGILNADEGDIDCGKMCEARCVVGRKCRQNADCTSNICVNNVCEAPACEDPAVGDVLITEILNYAASGSKFEGTETPQMEFIELYNGADRAVSLSNLSIVCERTDDGKGTNVTFEVPGQCLQAHGAAVLSKTEIPGLRDGVLSLAAFPKDNELSNNATYRCDLMLNSYGSNGKPRSQRLHSVVIANSKSGISAVLYPMEYMSDPTDLYNHNEVNPDVKLSPGMCTNGYLFAEGCVSHCENNVKDSDETDVDCGGSQCAKCGNGKSCSSVDDCSSGACDNNGVCASAGCQSDTECKALGGTCDLSIHACVFCNDGEKNGSETDVDCGGSCPDKCDANEHCNVPADCSSGVCEDTLCVGNTAESASPESLVINEVLGAVDSNRKFAFNDNASVCEFIEIVNTADKAVSVNGLKLTMQRVDKDERIDIDLAGTVVANGVLVVHNCSNLPLPADAAGLKKSTSELKIVDTAPYLATISKDEISTEPVSLDVAKKSSSYVREIDGDPSAAIILHSQISPVFASPGYCSNGGLFSEGCVSPCFNHEKDNDETDVDCGGALCGACGAGRSCSQGDDCLSESCNDGICAVGDCSVIGCEQGQFCDIATHSCHSCSDNVKNGDETDVDCGGASCGGCNSGLHCINAGDCASRQCQGSVCVGNASSCQTAAAGDIVISEFMNFAKVDEGMTTFGNDPVQRQVEFIELVNLSAHTVSLDGMKIVARQIAPASPNPVEIQLKGCLSAKQAAVVSGTAIAGLPKDVVNLVVMGSADVFSNAATFRIELVGSNGSVLHTIKDESQALQRISHALTDVSYVAGDNALVDHNSISEYNHSPGFCANGGLFVESCVSLCANNAQDDGETDIDCGGMQCDKCVNGKRCEFDSDCASDYCGAGICTDDPCAVPAAGDLVIDEVFSNVTSTAVMSNYDASAVQNQVEYIEIVNLTNKQLSLKGLKIEANRTDKADGDKDKYKYYELSGCVPQKQAVVVSGSQIAGMPSDVVNIVKLASTNALTNTATYRFSLLNAADVVLHQFEETAAPSRKAVARVIQTLGYQPLHNEVVDHDIVNPDLKHSPGYCTNGGLFTNGCIAPCQDNIQNHDESDVDCGGACGATCAYGKLCVKNDDCASNNCEPSTNRCGYDQCHNGKQDGDETAVDCGGSTCDPCSNGMSCLLDSDCLTNYCNESKFCAYDPCKQPATGDLVINEVLNNVGAGKPMSVYDPTVTTQNQVEFIEIVNLSNQMVSLKGLKIVAERQDKDDPKAFTLSGCVPANQAAVISGSSIAGLPSGVVNIIPSGMAAANALVNQPFKYSLVKADNSVLHSVIESAKPDSQKSRTLPNLAFTNGVATIVNHDSINDSLNHSPGYCTNGKLFIDGCR